jgi:hypothetical protein
MLRRSQTLGLFWAVNKLKHPPTHGYELSVLPDDKVLTEFLLDNKDHLVHVIIGNGEECPLTQKMTSVLHHTPLGQPKDVKLALLNASKCEKLIRDEGVLAIPTTLIYFRGKLIDRVVGTRPRELMVKSRFTLRNHDLSPYSY